MYHSVVAIPILGLQKACGNKWNEQNWTNPSHLKLCNDNVTPHIPCRLSKKQKKRRRQQEKAEESVIEPVDEEEDDVQPDEDSSQGRTK